MSDEPVFANLIFIKNDVDANADVAGACSVSAMPTIQIWKAGKKLDELVGADKNRLRSMAEKWAAAA
jgi:thioredoxin 1